MTGTECVHKMTLEAISEIYGRMYRGQGYDVSQLEDLVLMTSERTTYPDIGTDKISSAVLGYACQNADWINVCLFVNADFRSCFTDAIMIEKALLQVSDMDYKDFREDMVLASDKDRAAGKNIPIRLDEYSQRTADTIENIMSKGHTAFFDAGMTEAYDELMNGMDRDERDEVAYIAYNMMYVMNALNRNGVFRKYVTIVVDSVKKQLS